jgi:hypothetical protein
MTFGRSWRFCSSAPSSATSKGRYVRIKSLDDRLDSIYRYGRHDVRLVEQDDVRELELIGQSDDQSHHNKKRKRHTGR